MLIYVDVNATAYSNGSGGGAVSYNNGENQKLFTILQLTSVWCDHQMKVTIDFYFDMAFVRTKLIKLIT